MFSTKKDIDRHVKTSLNKLPEHERYLRGLAIARQYFKLNEYASAEHWLSCYLSVQEDSAPAHKLLGQCYEKQQKFDRAITSYQRSLQLDSKQTGLITDVCKLLLMDDNLTKHLAKAKHWCDLAESERINHEAVLNLKLKVANKDATSDSKIVKDIILKEILARPLDPSLRVRLMDHFLDEKRYDEAFKYGFELEMKFSEPFMQSIEWTNGLANMLTKYTESPPAGGGEAVQQRCWNYYLLQAIVLDRQIYLNLLADSTMETIKRNNVKEIANRLFMLDQTLRQVSEKGRNAAPQKQMADVYLRHYRGQLLLYSASLLFKMTPESSGPGRSRETGRKCLALLLLAYQCGVPDPDESWLKQSSTAARQLLAFWNKQAAFRCCQAGSTLLACVEEGADVSVLAQIQSVTETKVWTTTDDLLNQIRQFCSDSGWRHSVSRSLYPSGDLSTKAASSSYFVHDKTAFGEPQYLLPKRDQLERYLDVAQSLYPSSLPYLVYLGLAMGTDSLADWRCKSFPRLNFSTNNLESCSLETLNQLDMDSFLYCATLVARSKLDSGGERSVQQQAGRLSFLPAANLIPLLCEDAKIDWWHAAYHLIKSSTAKDAATNLAEQRQLLQHGLQAIRGTGAPLCDVLVLLKLGQILVKRVTGSSADERKYVEARAEAINRAGVLLWKMRHESSYVGGSLETASYGSEMFFRYDGRTTSYDSRQEAMKLAESAITFLAGVYFKHARYEEFTHDFGGIPLPFAAYFRAEAFKKLDESNRTPLKAKKFYAEQARECVRQTQRYLELPYVERNHPLHYVVQGELKRLSFANESFDGSLNVSANGGAGTSADESDHFQSFTSSLTNAAGGGGGVATTASGASRLAERDAAAAAAATAAASACLAKTNDLELLMRQLLETLTFVKEDVLGIRNDVGDMQDRLVKIEENIFRKPTENEPGATATSTPLTNDPAMVTAATAAALQTMKDVYLIDELQNSASALAYQHAAAAAAAAAAVRTPVISQQAGTAVPYHALYGPNAYSTYLPGQIQQQPQQMLTPRGHPMGAMGASPLHSAVYQHQHPDSLLVASSGSPASGAYHHPAFHASQAVASVPPPPSVLSTEITPVTSAPIPKATIGSGGSLSIEQSLQTPALLYSWNSTYNSALSSSVPETKGGAPVNVVITSSDPLPPQPSVNSSASTFATGPGVQPTYSVTIPPQHIKHSAAAVGGSSIGQGTAGGLSGTSQLENISPASNTKYPMHPILPAPAPATAGLSTPAAPLTSSFFANVVSPAKTFTDQVEDDDDDDKNVSGSAEYDPRPDFQPIIPLPDEVVVRTGEEDEEQIFTGRSKLLRLVEREWKERGLGELKILRSKVDPSRYRIVMRREQVHKICANHYITPELIIKPMEKRKECYIWAAMDFADEEPRKESFCARFGTAALASEFHDAFVAARDEVARLRPTGEQSIAAAPPPVAPGGFTFNSTPKSTPTAGATSVVAKPFGEFTFSKNYTPPAPANNAVTKSSTPSASVAAADNKPSPFASFTFKAQQTNVPFGNIFGGGSMMAGTLGFDEQDFQSAHETIVTGLKRKEQSASTWTDCVGVTGGKLRLLTSPTVVRLLLRNGSATEVQLNHIVDKDARLMPTEPNGCSWIGLSDSVYPTSTGGTHLCFMAHFKTPQDRDRFVDAVQKVLHPKQQPAAPAKLAPAASAGFGDLFKPKSGSWDCPGCYVNNKADASQCVACNSPRDPAKKDGGGITGGLFGSGLVAPADGANKFTFGVPATSTPGTLTFGTASAPKKTQEKQEVVVAVAPSGKPGFGDQFKPKTGSWTCNGCYLSNGADVLYCVSCESPKDDTVPKKATGGSMTTGTVLPGAANTTTMPKFNFAVGGGFTFGTPTAATPVPASSTVTTNANPAPNVVPGFGSGGFTFGNPLKPAQGSTAAATVAAGTPEKPVFKFELPTPVGGLSFGSKLTPNNAAADVGGSVGSSSAISKLDPPEKASFGFVFKPKSPGRTLSGDGDGVTDDDGGVATGGGGDTSVTEEENNTYFAPVIPLPDKVDVKTGEEDEDILYAHRSKLYRFISAEWKERGIGDVKILKHKATGKLRVVMRREQVLKICLNHALTEDICYTKKDDKSWQFVANDFSEGNFEIMNFCLRFKSPDIAQEFRDAIADALSGKLSVKEEGANAPSPLQLDNTITSTSSPVGDLSFSKLSDISLNERELALKLKLPAGFFDHPVSPCTGCRGCDPDAFVFPLTGQWSLVENDTNDDVPLPINIEDVKPLPPVSTSKKVTFDATTPQTSVPALAPPSGVGLFSGLSFGKPSATTSPNGSFLAAEQKASSTQPFAPTAATTGTIFGGAPEHTATTTTTTAGTVNNKFNFGSSAGTLFSATLNTTPKTSFVPSPVAGSTISSTSDADSNKTVEPAAVIDSTGGNNNAPVQPVVSTTKPMEGGTLFGSVNFGGAAAKQTTNIFGGAGLFSAKTPTMASNTTPPVSNSKPSPLFGSNIFGGATKPPMFGSGDGTSGGGFTFGSVAKQQQATTPSATGIQQTADSPVILTMDENVSFASLASNNGEAFSTTGAWKTDNNGTKPTGGFVGLTVKEDFFSRSAAVKLNSSADGTTNINNGNGGDDAAGGAVAGGEVAGVGDENYDPYYAPVITLPDEIEVRTGEEEEAKLFGERSKLYRYDSTTKEWKERGVGELKILHHPVRNTYRLLLRREQIYMLVLNHAITADLAFTPHNNSEKSFMWGAMNYAEAQGQLEQLAVRFTNGDIASKFRSVLDKCQEQLRSRPDLEPDQD